MIGQLIIPLPVVLPLVLLPLFLINSQVLLLPLLDSRDQVPLLLIPLALVARLRVLLQLLLVLPLVPSQPIQVLMALELLLPILILTVAEALILLSFLHHITFRPPSQHVVTVLILA